MENSGRKTGTKRWLIGWAQQESRRSRPRKRNSENRKSQTNWMKSIGDRSRPLRGWNSSLTFAESSRLKRRWWPSSGPREVVADKSGIESTLERKIRYSMTRMPISLKRWRSSSTIKSSKWVRISRTCSVKTSLRKWQKKDRRIQRSWRWRGAASSRSTFGNHPSLQWQSMVQKLNLVDKSDH